MYRNVSIGLCAGFALTVAAAAVAEAQSFPLWDRLEGGPHAIGHKVVYAIDATRAFPGSNDGRPIEIRVWYPAMPAADAQRMRYERYLDPRPDSGRATVVTDALHARTRGIHRYAQGKYLRADTAGALARLLNMETAAYANAAALPGPFRVIVYAGGAGNATDENVVLWELLASSGYIVAAVPAQGHLTHSVTLDAAGLETETRDMEFALGWLRGFPGADVTRLATLGFSWGGVSALLLAMRNQQVDAVVAFDASLIAARYVPIVKHAPMFAHENLTAPLLEFHAASPDATIAIVDSLRYADRESFEVTALDHIDFNSYVLLYSAVARPRAARDSALAAKRAAYRAMVRYTVAYLDQHVKRESAYMRVASWPGYPSDRLRISERAKLPAPMRRDELLALIMSRGIDVAEQAHNELRLRDPHAPVLSEASLNDVGYDLLQSNPQAAVRVFLWNVRAHPASANAFDSLADGFIATGNRGCAATAYRRVLERADADPLLFAGDRAALRRRATAFLESANLNRCLVELP